MSIARPPAADRARGRRRRHRAGAAPPRAADRGRRRAAARLRATRTASSVAAAAAGPTRRIRSTPASASSLRAARVRPAHAVPADRLHAGQPRDQPRCWSSRALRLLDPQPGERVIDLVLRPRQLHAADRDARRAGARHRGQRALVERARAQRGGERPRRRSSRSRDLFEPSRRLPFGRCRQVADRSAARGRAIERRRSSTARAGVAAAHRLRLLQSGDAGARRRPAGARAATAARRRAWSTCSRTRRTSRASRSSSAARAHEARVRSARVPQVAAQLAIRTRAQTGGAVSRQRSIESSPPCGRRSDEQHQ